MNKRYSWTIIEFQAMSFVILFELLFMDRKK